MSYCCVSPRIYSVVCCFPAFRLPQPRACSANHATPVLQSLRKSHDETKFPHIKPANLLFFNCNLRDKFLYTRLNLIIYNESLKAKDLNDIFFIIFTSNLTIISNRYNKS